MGRRRTRREGGGDEQGWRDWDGEEDKERRREYAYRRVGGRGGREGGS